jgi:hypothetical protein
VSPNERIARRSRGAPSIPWPQERLLLFAQSGSAATQQRRYA